MTEGELEQEMLTWLISVGYTALNARELESNDDRLYRENNATVLLINELRVALQRLNPHIPATALADALQQAVDIDVPDQLGANRALHRLLVNGVPVQYQLNGETRGDFARLIDWESTSQNSWLAVQQFTIRGPKHTRRPDVILFVNGIPLVLIELKNPVEVQADIWMAYEQIQTYKQQIPDVFIYNELLIISDGTQARFGSLSATPERFMRWRTIDGLALDPLGQFQELETMVRGLLPPAVLLDYIRYFVLFEDDTKLVKKVAGYHQFHAVCAAIEQVVAAVVSREDANRGKGGVVWHTQGSGKSITMTCFAARAMQDARLGNPTIVVITDRNDLDGQLLNVFGLSQDLLRVEPEQATSRERLRELLENRPAGGILFATIQKFMPEPGETVFPCLSDRRNILVMADEAHRTQYGFQSKLKGKSGAEFYQPGYAQHLRDALPNATFVAFTGTPVSSTDRDTAAVFGDHIHVYDMQQAQEDGATVAIYYESRLIKLDLRDTVADLLDAQVEALTEDEEESQESKLKSQWAALEKVVGAEPRISKVAADLVSHFELRNQVQDGKAMVVSMSRDICVHLYNEIVQHRPDWHDDDVEKGTIKVVMTGSASDTALLQPHIYNATQRRRIEKRFKDPADPLRMVIVRDMWLTGFDVPCVHTMYVDKPMKGVNLMQAIARVNRVFKDKQGGLVVDYIGIGEDLKRAIRDYTTEKGHSRPAVDSHEALAIVQEKLDVLRAMLNGFDFAAYAVGGQKLVAQAADFILGLVSPTDRDGKRRFSDSELALSRALTLCITLPEAQALRDEIAFMHAVKVTLTKGEVSAARLTNETRDFAMRQIINDAVVSKGVVEVFAAVGLDKPNIGLLDAEFLASVQRLPERNLAIDLLQRLMKDEIKSKFSINVVQNRKFSAMLADVIRRYQNRSIETAQVMQEMIDMALAFREATMRGERLGLLPDEEKFYDALANNESAVIQLQDETLKLIAQELTTSLRKNLSVDWSHRESVRAKLRLLVRRILRKYKYPPDMAEDAVTLVLEQAERLGEAWS